MQMLSWKVHQVEGATYITLDGWLIYIGLAWILIMVITRMIRKGTKDE